MRHRRKGRRLGRSSSHRRALMRNLACALILTERDEMFYEGMMQSDGKTAVKPPRFKGRIVTTLHKAKEVRPMVEKCITIAKKALAHQEAAEQFGTSEDRNSDAWRSWRESDQWRKWNEAMAPAIAARRRVNDMLRDKEAVQILFEEIAPRFVDRPGGYTRILRMAKPRLGDAGVQGILEFVGVHDRVKQKSERPSFADDSPVETPQDDEAPASDSSADADTSAADDSGDDKE